MTAVDPIFNHVESDAVYYLRCSDCEGCTGEWHNSALAVAEARDAAWRIFGERLLCSLCAAKYPAESLRAA